MHKIATCNKNIVKVFVISVIFWKKCLERLLVGDIRLQDLHVSLRSDYKCHIYVYSKPKVNLHCFCR